MIALLRTILNISAGPACRRCDVTIGGDDPFGQSEGVCRPCRG